MNNPSKKLRQAYYNLLNGNVTYNSTPVEIFKEDVPAGYQKTHVVIRVEGATDDLNRRQGITIPIVITEVIYVSQTSVNPDVLDDIDDQIRAILQPYNGARILKASGFEICLIRPINSHYLSEDDGTKRYYRKITRWQQRITQ